MLLVDAADDAPISRTAPLATPNMMSAYLNADTRRLPSVGANLEEAALGALNC